jgi:hypothetical protein
MGCICTLENRSAFILALSSALSQQSNRAQNPSQFH